MGLVLNAGPWNRHFSSGREVEGMRERQHPHVLT
jgi:hypothetical protein